MISDGCTSPVAIDSVRLTVHPTPVINFLPHLIRGCTPVEASFADNSVASPAHRIIGTLEINIVE